MQENRPFIVYAMCSEEYPVGVLTGKSLTQADNSSVVGGSALILSGGLRKNADPDCALPTGLLAIDTIGRTYAEQLIGSLVSEDDSVVVVDELSDKLWSKWRSVADDLSAQIYRSGDSIVVMTNGAALRDIPWCHDIPAASTTQVFVFRHDGASSLRDAIESCIHTELCVSHTMREFARKRRRDPVAALVEMGDFRLWAFVGGFDAQDIWVVRGQSDVSEAQEAVRRVAQQQGASLYQAASPQSMETSGFFTEDGRWREVPDDWRRVA